MGTHQAMRRSDGSDDRGRRSDLPGSTATAKEMGHVHAAAASWSREQWSMRGCVCGGVGGRKVRSPKQRERERW